MLVVMPGCKRQFSLPCSITKSSEASTDEQDRQSIESGASIDALAAKKRRPRTTKRKITLTKTKRLIMKIISISDLHGDTKNINALYKSCGPVDLTLITGDLTHFGAASQARQVIDAVRACCPDVLAVAGNCDEPDVEEYLQDENISLHQRAQVRAGLVFVGMGQSLVCPAATPNVTDEAGFKAGLDKAASQAPADLPLILVVHQPPYDTKNDRVFFGKHVGSHSIRAFIEEKRPILTVCGHIHEGNGIDRIGRTTIVNPGPLPKGCYGFVDTGMAEWQMEIRTIQ